MYLFDSFLLQIFLPEPLLHRFFVPLSTYEHVLKGPLWFSCSVWEVEGNELFEDEKVFFVVFDFDVGVCRIFHLIGQRVDLLADFQRELEEGRNLCCCGAAGGDSSSVVHSEGVYSSCFKAVAV